MGGRTPQCQRTGKIITTVIVWLLLGAIVNVAVAWGFVARTTLYNNPVTLMSSAETRAFVTRRVGAPSDDGRGLLGMQRNTLGATLTAVPYARHDPEMIVYEFLYDWRYGWPMRSFATDAQVSDTGRPGSLPTTPLWRGMGINTVFYATLLWLLFAAPFALRRRRRIKRGLCPKCAYPVGESPVCTECGNPVSVRNVEPSSS